MAKAKETSAVEAQETENTPSGAETPPGAQVDASGASQPDISTSDNTDETTGPDDDPQIDLKQEAAADEVVLVSFPLQALKDGARARRMSWKSGHTITLGVKGNRGKVEQCFLQSGSRSGQIEWKPKGLSDLLADDWLVESDGAASE